MHNTVTIFMPDLFNQQTVALCNQHMPSLCQLIKHQQKHDTIYDKIKHAINDLPIAKALITQKNIKYPYAIIAECVHIDLDHTQGYLRALDASHISKEVEQLIQQQLIMWAEDIYIEKIPNKLAWLITSNEEISKTNLSRPDLLIGESIINQMPKASDGVIFSWFNELQMMLHALPEIADTGINSFWFWGNATNASVFDGFISCDEYLQKLTKKEGLSMSTQYDLSVFQTEEDHVLYLDPRVKIKMRKNLVEYYQIVEKNLFKPLLKDFTKKKIKTLELCFSSEESYRLNSSAMHKWWKIFAKNKGITHDKN